MKKVLSIISGMFICAMISAQSISVFAFTTTGGSYSGSNFSADYSIGEVFTGTLNSDPNFILTQGVIQPEILSTSIDPAGIGQNGEISFYPNPFVEYINITIKEINQSKITVKIIDITGKTRFEEDYKLETKSGKIQLDVKELNPGIYFISVSADDKLLKSNKLYKK